MGSLTLAQANAPVRKAAVQAMDALVGRRTWLDGHPRSYAPKKWALRRQSW